MTNRDVAADVYDYGASAVCFSSRLDGNVCIAVFEGPFSARGATGEPPTSRILIMRAAHSEVQVARPGQFIQRQWPRVDRSRPVLAGDRDNQTRCLAVENEHQSDLLEPMLR